MWAYQSRVAAMAEAAISLGSNLGDRAAYLAAALRAIDGRPECSLISVSSVYWTQPWGKTDQGEFLNLCAIIDTRLAPQALLDVVKGIERMLGRTEGERWGPREIDIDLLVMDGVTRESEVLTLPHPRMVERLFVLAPLAEIAPELVVAGQRVDELAATLKTKAGAGDCTIDAEASARIRSGLSPIRGS
ncbi:2-amino-4-hydroxy-6-hydroxymethyldihydropteridine diphosphokinase [Hyphomonas sp.]|jgi:2-amino-4-hydroxy-6-hydroxymethyldihydropteridine diphosphokinase|uniref:2-amino-4-hydroxy-6- hydroxymethyldihydropteridine diphosphokinase n=1 Tax=Hyphomonas sp. TaxID=87 RepID=UPI0039E55CEF